MGGLSLCRTKLQLSIVGCTGWLQFPKDFFPWIPLVSSLLRAIDRAKRKKTWTICGEWCLLSPMNAARIDRVTGTDGNMVSLFTDDTFTLAVLRDGELFEVTAADLARLVGRVELEMLASQKEDWNIRSKAQRALGFAS
jgi:hypothetical protein